MSLTISACTTNNATGARVVRIGYQKSGELFLVKFKGGLDKRLARLKTSVEWSEFTSGPPQLQAVAAGALDFAPSGSQSPTEGNPPSALSHQTADTPVVVAQASGADVVYIANTSASPKSLAILVPNDSTIKTVTDLKGKKVAFVKASSPQYLVVQALSAAGLKYEQIKPINLQPPDALAAFARGSIDAWAVPDPYFASAQRTANARVLVDGEGLVPFREFYLASRSFAQKNPDLVKELLQEIQDVGAAAQKNPQEVVKFLAPYLKLPLPTTQLAVGRNNRFDALPIQSEALAEQQKLADQFFQLKLISKPIKVTDAAWSSKQ